MAMHRICGTAACMFTVRFSNRGLTSTAYNFIELFNGVNRVNSVLVTYLRWGRRGCFSTFLSLQIPLLKAKCVKQRFPSAIILPRIVMIDWHNIFCIDIDNGKLCWKHPKLGRKQDVGWVNANGYRYFEFEGKAYRVHRVIWEMMYGPIPKEKIIDHINGNKDDNRVVNLRIATYSQNQFNKANTKTNPSGRTGVTKSKNKAHGWKVEIKLNGKNKYIGSFDTIEDAIKAREMAEQVCCGEFRTRMQ